MEGVSSRHFSLSELLLTFPLVHSFCYPSSPHISIPLEAPTEALACVVGSRTVLHGKDHVSFYDHTVCAGGGRADMGQLPPSCDPRLCS